MREQQAQAPQEEAPKDPECHLRGPTRATAGAWGVCTSLSVCLNVYGHECTYGGVLIRSNVSLYENI